MAGREIVTYVSMRLLIQRSKYFQSLHSWHPEIIDAKNNELIFPVFGNKCDLSTKAFEMSLNILCGEGEYIPLRYSMHSI